MKKKKRLSFSKSFVAAVMGLSLSLTVALPVLAMQVQPYTYEAYTYDAWANVKESPSMFRVVDHIDGDNMEGIPMSSADDVHYADGLIYMVDSIEARVNVFTEDFDFVSSIKLMRAEDGRIALDDSGHQLILVKPEGLFVDEANQELYIADPGAQRIFILDSKTFILKNMIGKPAEMLGVTSFEPSKVTVDTAGRIYAVVQSSYEGIIELNQDGSFSRYFGVNSPQVNLLDHFWKSIATDAQKQKMQKLFAPSFNNVTVDSEGFVFATTFDANAIYDIFRLNGRGQNVLREEGHILVGGDVNRFDMGETQFVDVTVTDYGVYAGLDRARGRIFLYDHDGYTLNVFNGLGNAYGQLRTPTGISWMGDKLLVSDRTMKRIYVYDTTDFGAAALAGSAAYHVGDWEAANTAFTEALKHNANYDIAYVGIGKNHLMQNEYEDAMYYFEKGNSHDYYSTAYSGYRTILLQEYFGWIFAVIVILLAVIFISEYRYHKKEEK